MESTTNKGPDTRVLLAFLAAVVIGGANFIAVRVSNQEFPPFYGATVRFGFATMLFFLYAWARRVPRPSSRALAGAAAYGFLGFGVAYALLYYALVVLAAGTVSVIVAASPLATLLLAVAMGQERLAARGVAGGIMAMVGIGVLSAGSLEGGLATPYLVAAVLATLAIAASSVIARAQRDVHPVNMNAYGMLAGTVVLAVGSVVAGEEWTVATETSTWVAVAWLVVLGSVGLFQLFLYVIKHWTASATVYAVAAMPLVAVSLDAILLGQAVTASTVIGGVLVVAAVYVGAIAGGPHGTRADD